MLFRALLYLYPASFRAEYGAEIERIFRQRRLDARGPLDVIALWAEAIADTVTTAVPAHWDILLQDLRYAVRSLRKSPGFTAAVLSVAAVGIGATTAAFSLTDHVLLRPLPFPEPDRLVKLWEVDASQGYGRLEASPPNYRDWKAAARSFSAMAAYSLESVNLQGDDGSPERLDATRGTWELMQVLGAHPAVGRNFSEADDRTDSVGTVILSDALWRRRFGRDASILGRTLRLNGEPYTVIGVMPAGFAFPVRDTALWTTQRFAEERFTERDNTYLRVLARLAPGVTLAQARAEMRAIAASLERQWPKDNHGIGANATALRDEIAPRARWLVLALAGAAACVLLIGCTNVANLLLARAMERRPELAVRTAIGAGRERLVRQLLTESLTLSLAGGGLGVLLAKWSLPLLTRLVPAALPVSEDPAIDLRVLAAAAALSIATGLILGIAPAIRASGGTQLAGLREGMREGGGRRQRLRGALTVAEVTLSMVLLVSCGLLVRAMWRLESVDPGFRSDGVLTMRTSLPMPKYLATAVRVRFYRRVLEGARALPGVTGAAYTSFLPMLPMGGIWPVEIAGREATSGLHSAMLRMVTPGYFGVMGIAVLTGRDISEQDGPNAPFAAVVSESFARQYWPGQNPLGRHFKFAFFDRTVVGVVGDVRMRGLERESEPQVYLSYQQIPDGYMPWHAPKDLVVKAQGNVVPLAAALRRIVASADSSQPVSDVRTMLEIVALETAPRQVQVRVLGAFAAVAMLLAGIGLHGLLSFMVSMRGKEIGVRMALGAQRGDIVRMIAGSGLRLALAGVVCGSVGAWAAGRSMEALLAGISVWDGAVWGTAIAVTAGMALAGSIAPAMRAIRVDPGKAVRGD